MPYCACLCHSVNRGNQRACAHAGRFLEAFAWAQQATENDQPVADTEVIAAAVACDRCRHAHCAALSFPKHVVQWRAPRTQADGWTGEEGG